MKRKYKKLAIYIVASIIVLIIANLVFLYNFTKPIQVQHVWVVWGAVIISDKYHVKGNVGATPYSI